MTRATRYDIGIDIGGTFTDVVCRRPGRPMLTTKIMSTRQNPNEAVMQALRYMVENWGIAPEDVGHFLHGTTVATNAVLERKGARLGLLTTAGFKDVLEIGRQMRQALYGIILEPETPDLPGRRQVPQGDSRTHWLRRRGGDAARRGGGARRGP